MVLRTSDIQDWEGGYGDYGPLVGWLAPHGCARSPRATNPRERHVRWQWIISISVGYHTVVGFPALETIGIDKSLVMSLRVFFHIDVKSNE